MSCVVYPLGRDQDVMLNLIGDSPNARQGTGSRAIRSIGHSRTCACACQVSVRQIWTQQYAVVCRKSHATPASEEWRVGWMLAEVVHD